MPDYFISIRLVFRRRRCVTHACTRCCGVQLGRRKRAVDAIKCLELYLTLTLAFHSRAISQFFSISPPCRNSFTLHSAFYLFIWRIIAHIPFRIAVSLASRAAYVFALKITIVVGLCDSGSTMRQYLFKFLITNIRFGNAWHQICLW